MADLPPCDPDLYRNGTIIGMYDTSYMGAKGFDKIVQAVVALTGCSCDWHYIAGRAIVKAFDEDFVEVRNALEAIYTYEYNRVGPEWTKQANMMWRGDRTPEFCTSKENALEQGSLPNCE